MGYTKDTAFVDGNPAANQLLGRTIADEIRDHMPADAFLMKLIAKTKVDKGKVSTQAGLIKKKVSDHSRVEAFTHTPKVITQSPTAVSTLDLTLANAATQLTTRMMFQNTANNTVGVIDKISGTTVSFISIGSTFSASVGDTLMYLGNDYEYGSDDPGYISNTDDNIYNILHIERHPIATTLSAKDSRQEAGGNLFDRYKNYEMTHSARAIERAFLFSKRASSGNTTSLTDLGVSIPTTQGLWDVAQSSYSFNGSQTFEKWVENVPNKMHNSMDRTKQYLCFMSNLAFARIIAMQQNNAWTWRESKGNVYEKWGVRAEVLVTSGPEIAIVAHDAFNYGNNVGKALLILPEDIEYRYKNGNPPLGKNGKAGAKNRDMSIVLNTESNSSDTQKDEFFSESGLLELAGGYSTMKLTELV